MPTSSKRSLPRLIARRMREVCWAALRASRGVVGSTNMMGGGSSFTLLQSIVTMQPYHERIPGVLGFLPNRNTRLVIQRI